MQEMVMIGTASYHPALAQPELGQQRHAVVLTPAVG